MERKSLVGTLAHPVKTLAELAPRRHRRLVKHVIAVTVTITGAALGTMHVFDLRALDVIWHAFAWTIHGLGATPIIEEVLIVLGGQE